MWVRGQEVLGCAVQVREVASSSARDQDFLPDSVALLQENDSASPFPCLDSAHQSCGARAENENVAFAQ